MISRVANFSEKLPVLFFFLLLSVATANLSCLLETTFSSLRFLFNFTSLQSFESGQRGFLFSFSGVILNPQPFFPLFFCLFSVLFREVISHPYISFFHLLINGFSVTSFRTFLKTPYLYYTGGQYQWAGRN